ncbi:MAG: Uma2 family endonuclease [Bacteroidota bacterium]
MAAPALKTRMTPDEFFAWEAEQLDKHEYYYGEVFAVHGIHAVAGGSTDHALIAANATRDIGGQLRGGPCRTFSSDLAVEIDAAGHFVYPDLTIVCGELRTRDDRPLAQNPTLVLEVLSPSTEQWDRGGKFEAYRRLPSVQTVVLVASEVRHVEVYTRDGDGWHLAEADARGLVSLGAVPAELSIESLYDGVEVGDRPTHPGSAG